jgi:predicted permease
VILSQPTVQTLVLFILMAVGYAAGKLRYIDEAVGRGLSRFLVNLVVPALILGSMQRPFSPALRDEAFAVLGISFAVYALSFPLAALLVAGIGAKGASRGPHGFAAIFGNVAFMGFPVMQALLGKESLFALAIYNIPFQLLAFSVGPVILARSAGHGARLSPAAFVSPGAIAAFLGFGLFMGNVALPGFLQDSLRILGDTTTPLSMALIGAIISRIDLRRLAGDWRFYATSLYRLAVFPLIVYLLLRVAGVRGNLLYLPVIASAMPVAVNSAILASAWGGDEKTASSLVLVSTLASVLTIPVVAGLLLGV